MKQNYLKLTILALLFCVTFSYPAKAQDAETQQNQSFESLSDQKKLKVLNGQLLSFAAELFSDLGPNELESVYAIRTSYGIVQSVKLVRSDLNKAVNSCVENNDNMESLQTSFDAWKNDINPIVQEANLNIILAIEEQKVVDSRKFRAYLERIDKLVQIQEDIIDKDYVTDREACNKLKDRLDETKARLTELLKKSIKET